MSKKKKRNANTKEILVEEVLEGKTTVDKKDQPQTESDAPVNKAASSEAVVESPLVELSPDEIMELKTELEESQAKANEYLDGWQRARAEFANYKKRVDRDRERFHKDAVGDITKHYLPIVDDLERALKDRLQEGDATTWSEGIELIYRKMLNILEANGVTPITAEGEFFDPNLHEAIAKTESDEYKSEQVIEVLQQGYMIGDRVLRPATVRIAA